MWKLTIEDEEGKRTTVPLSRDDYSIGRKEGNTIRLTERNVSRDHAKIRRANGPTSPYVVEDHESYNGIYVNGLRVAEPQQLEHGDLIQIGDYRIVLQDEGAGEEIVPVIGATTEQMKSTIPTGQMNRGSQLTERPNRLVMLAGPTPGAEYPLTGERVTIGRAEDATISVNHNSVSRLHCEIHALGEGRFEVVDKGSSNGVRVNGSDLRRGIIEAGDVIELGDVRLRFVGAGQVFVPGVGDSQQLEAFGDRAQSIPAPRAAGGASTIVPWAILGAVVAGIAMVGGWMYIGQGTPAPAGSGAVVVVSAEDAALEAAKTLCDQGNCEVAHDKLTVGLSAASPLRASPAFAAIESKWADGVLQRADQEPDLSRRRSLLNLVASATTAPEPSRAVAAAKLKELDSAPSGRPPAASTTKPPVVAPTQAAPSATSPQSTPAPRPTTVATAATAATVATVKSPPARSPLDRAAALALNGDSAGARAILEPRVMSGKGSTDEVNLLKGICKSQGDKVCTAAIKKLYP